MADTLIQILREYIPKKKQIEIEVSHAMNKKYTCANPEGPVSNEFCPEEDPLCNCPCKDLIPKSISVVTAQWLSENKYEFSENDFSLIYYNDPTENPWAVVKGVYEDKGDDAEEQTAGGNNPTYELFGEATSSFHATEEEAIEAMELAYEDTGGYTMDEPTDSYMDSLLKASSECDAIGSELGESWLGCDWDDPNSPMSCDCPCVGEDYNKYLRYNSSLATFWDTPGYVPMIANAHKEALQSQKIGISVPGDLSIRPGDLIFLDLMDVPHGFEEIDTIARKYGIITPIEKNAKFHGRWMVSSIRHRMFGVSYHKMDLILIRDGVPYKGDEEGASETSSSAQASVPFVPITSRGSASASSSPLVPGTVQQTTSITSVTTGDTQSTQSDSTTTTTQSTPSQSSTSYTPPSSGSGY
tara:strand:- start:2434 stop:3672 length:1239 start_codon:yes stop_codon:yes gene_type:complete